MKDNNLIMMKSNAHLMTLKIQNLSLLILVVLTVMFQANAQEWRKTGSEKDKYNMGGDPTVPHGSSNPAYIRSISTYINGGAAYETTMEAGPYVGGGISLTAYVKASNVKIWAGMLMRVRGPEGSLTFDNMEGRPIYGNTDWKQYQIILDVPEGSTEISYGFWIGNTGSLQFDGLEVNHAPRTWMTLSTPEGVSAVSIDAVDSLTVWAGSDNGAYLRSIDGGDTWITGSITNASGLFITSIEAIDAMTAYCTAQSLKSPQVGARIFKTSDGGTSWDLQYRNKSVGAFFNAISFWNESNGIAVSDPINDQFLIVTTADGGLTWTEVPGDQIPPPLEGEFAGFGNAGGTVVAVSGDDHAWFGTAYASDKPGNMPVRIFRSKDRGQSWTASLTPWTNTEFSDGITSLSFIDTLLGFAGCIHSMSRGNALSVTNDGGLNWTLVDSFPVNLPLTIAVDPVDHNIYITSLQGTVFSSDLGVNWQHLSTESYVALSFGGHTSGWATRERDGKISKLLPNMTTSAVEIPYPKHVGYELEQSYPNPFLGTSTIRFTIPQRMLVELVVYDMMGKKIKTIFSSITPAGTHSASLDLSEYNEGLYAIHMVAGSFQRTRIVECLKK